MSTSPNLDESVSRAGDRATVVGNIYGKAGPPSILQIFHEHRAASRATYSANSERRLAGSTSIHNDPIEPLISQLTRFQHSSESIKWSN